MINLFLTLLFVTAVKLGFLWVFAQTQRRYSKALKC
jgi:hypothetical protein